MKKEESDCLYFLKKTLKDSTVNYFDHCHGYGFYKCKFCWFYVPGEQF